MGQAHKSRDELLKELEEAVLRVRELERLLLESPQDKALLNQDDLLQESPYDKSAAINSFESTQTLDLTSLFSQDVTSSGSFYTKGIRKTLFGRLLEALPVPSLLISGSREVIFANRAWGRTSISCENVVGKRFANLFPVVSVAEELDALAGRVFTTRKVFGREAVISVDERKIWGRLTLRSIRLGPERLLLVLVEDLTSLKKQLLQIQEYQGALKHEIERREIVEEALRENQLRLELALKGADLSSWDWNIQTGLLICDKCFAENLGYSVDEITPRKESWEILVHKDDRPRFRAAITNHLLGESPFLECEHRIRTKDGKWKWVFTRGKVSVWDDEGKPLRALGTNLDVTERKQLEQRNQFLTRAMIQAVERERERISLDLHDEVAQDLVALRLVFETMFDDLNDVTPDLKSRVSQASNRLQDLVKTVRGISYHLRPSGLDKLGLVSTVSQYCREFSERNPIRVEFSPQGMDELQLDFDTEINLFRVVQESLNNVRKHAQADNVTIRLIASVAQIILSIKDDGRGFQGDSLQLCGHEEQQMGLWSMEQRIAILRGKLTIRSNPHEGTEVLVEVPRGGGKIEQDENFDRGRSSVVQGRPKDDY